MPIHGHARQGEDGLTRCPFAYSHPLYLAYHDEEWGTPERDPRKLFEFLVLEGMQAGLSWTTILAKREALRQAFAGFDPHRLAAFTDDDRQRLLENKDIIRNRLKIAAAVNAARIVVDMEKRGESLTEVIWDCVDNKTIHNPWLDQTEVPSTVPQAHTLSKSLRGLGFSFVGPTVCYALMQAAGLVNDHLETCFRHQEIKLLDSVQTGT